MWDIPFEPYIFGTAVNNGEMLASVKASSVPVRQVEAVAESIAGRKDGATSKRGGGFFSFLKGGS